MTTCTFPRATLRASFASIAKACDRKNTIPILACVLVREIAGAVTLTTSDLDVWASATVKGATAPDGFTAALDFHKLRDAERKAPPSEAVSITISGKSAVVAFGALQMAIPAHDPADFPHANFRGEALADFALPTPALRSALDATAFAMSTDETRYYLNGVFLHPAPGGGALRFVSTDGHRLAHHDVPGDFSGVDFRAIVPRQSVAMLARLASAKGGAADAAITIGPMWARVTIGGTEIATKLIDGTYPDYSRCIPRDFDHTARLDRRALANGVTAILATMGRRGGAVRMSWEACALTLAAGDGEGGAAEIALPADYDGDAFDIGFNARYLVDLLEAAEGDTVTLQMNDAGAPMRMEGAANSVFVLMPMRVGCRPPVAAVVKIETEAEANATDGLPVAPQATTRPPDGAISPSVPRDATSSERHRTEAISGAATAHPPGAMSEHRATPGEAISCEAPVVVDLDAARERRAATTNGSHCPPAVAQPSAGGSPCSARVIILGDGRRVGLGAYVDAWRRVRGAPPGASFRGSPCGWRHVEEDAAEILRQFRAGMADRINRHLPWYGRGRRWDPDWQAEARRLAHQVNTPRLVVRWAPFEFRDRLAHRLAIA